MSVLAGDSVGNSRVEALETLVGQLQVGRALQELCVCVCVRGG